MDYKILLIDDNESTFKWISEYNKKHNLGYQIESVKSTVDIVSYLSSHPVDLILTAWNLEESSGIELVKDIRLNVSTSHIPVIFCTKKEDVSDQIYALNQGADDYYRKSLPPELLFSKINAILRKTNRERNDCIQISRKFSFLDDTLEVKFSGLMHKLTNKEYNILKILVENPKKVFSQEDLNRITSGSDIHVSRRCVDTFINLLRRKFGRESIIAVRKKGYKLNDMLLLQESDD
jgi:two-component system alkaline phosphatase synthesis response regulator PhoP